MPLYWLDGNQFIFIKMSIDESLEVSITVYEIFIFFRKILYSTYSEVVSTEFVDFVIYVLLYLNIVGKCRFVNKYQINPTKYSSNSCYLWKLKVNLCILKIHSLQNFYITFNEKFYKNYLTWCYDDLRIM